ncbi:MAG: biotin synthase BioB [Eubacteriales bacterium]
MLINELKTKVLQNIPITKAEAIALYEQPLEVLSVAANEIRIHFCGNGFDICTIVNGKSGKCSEDCKFCAQSSFYNTSTESYSFLDQHDLIEQAHYNQAQGVLRYSIVTSGRALNNTDLGYACDVFRRIHSQVGIATCASFGLLNESQYRKLKSAGVTRIHNNLESSRNYFPNICTTHTYDDKLDSIHAALNAGLNVCSGGLMGLGESIQDRIDMAFELRNLGIQSVPLNILNPILGTPFEALPLLTTEDIQRIVAVYRFILPTASIRLAGGRGLLLDKGKSCFLSGANAAISGDMLTTSGTTIKSDLALIEKLGYTPSLFNQ